MSEKRRDNKGRVLRDGESQLPDGRYRYRYKSWDGQDKVVYSWRLDRHDRMVKGKKCNVSLREMEKQITADNFDRVATNGGGMTVLELVEKYVGTRTGVRATTRRGYQTVINLLKKDPFGKKRIDLVKKSDAMTWLVKLQKKDGRSYNAIASIRGVLRPAFRLAYDDDLIRKNPFDFMLVSVVINDSITREAVSREDERRFLEFTKSDKHFSKYYEGMFILFKTGMRISEFCGLTIKDIDLKNHKITVVKQLLKDAKVGYYVETTKTEAGQRELPMTPEVEACFKKIIENRRPPKPEPMIDGYAGFLYFDKDGSVMHAMHWERYFQHICEKYNSIYRAQLPKITPHICRHTYCTNMAKSGMSPKTLQYLMGHSDIAVTLNTYTHFGFEDAAEEVKRLDTVI